ncbi:MAG TPA: hypothetical protein VG454_05035 [Gemmatimonadales bacterium]|nr:hypothetical protein [Gemmatimonadales bacterium]
MSRQYRFLILVALLAACERPGDPQRARVAAGRALRGSLTYPRSTMVDVAAGEEAAQLTMTSPDSVGMVVDWFRRALPMNGWTIQRQAAGTGGTFSLYAKNGTRPLWITFRPNVGAAGSSYTMIGQIPTDSTKR